jgi:hypothetical protein
MLPFLLLLQTTAPAPLTEFRPGGILNIRGRAIGALRDQLALELRRQQTAGK